jgi:hypothetical protein
VVLTPSTVYADAPPSITHAKHPDLKYEFPYYRNLAAASPATFDCTTVNGVSAAECEALVLLSVNIFLNVKIHVVSTFRLFVLYIWLSQKDFRRAALILGLLLTFCVRFAFFSVKIAAVATAEAVGRMYNPASSSVRERHCSGAWSLLFVKFWRMGFRGTARYANNRGRRWRDSAGWLATPDICYWRGVACDRDGISYLDIHSSTIWPTNWDSEADDVGCILASVRHPLGSLAANAACIVATETTLSLISTACMSIREHLGASLNYWSKNLPNYLFLDCNESRRLAASY